MRGTCAQAIIELLHSEKRREDLTCVSTDFYPLLMEHNFALAKRLLHPDEGYKADWDSSWNVPTNRIATAQSRILLILVTLATTGSHSSNQNEKRKASGDCLRLARKSEW